jgi:hypothetical protein
MGIERITMLKYQIKDLRLFSENDVRFLRQFTQQYNNMKFVKRLSITYNVTVMISITLKLFFDLRVLFFILNFSGAVEYIPQQTILVTDANVAGQAFTSVGIIIET